MVIHARNMEHFRKASSLVVVQAWRWQQDLVSELISENGSGRVGSVLLLQHPPVLTLGAGSTEDHLRCTAKSLEQCVG